MHYDRYAAHKGHLLSNRSLHKSTLLKTTRGGLGVFAFFFAHCDGLFIHGYVISNDSDMCIVTTKIDISHLNSQKLDLKACFCSYLTFMCTCINLVLECFQTHPGSIHRTLTNIQKHIIQPTTKRSAAKGGNHWYLRVASEHPAVLNIWREGLPRNSSSQQPRHYDHNRSYN